MQCDICLAEATWSIQARRRDAEPKNTDSRCACDRHRETLRRQMNARLRTEETVHHWKRFQLGRVFAVPLKREAA